MNPDEIMRLSELKAAASVRPSVRQVMDALGAVRDPELNEPITELGFVASCSVSSVSSDSGGARVAVRLRLPTYFCAPNFAYLMVADAYDAVSEVPGVSGAEIVLEDHFAASAINEGVAARAGFVRSFPGEARAELDALRVSFLGKAVMAGTDQVCRSLAAEGVSPGLLAEMTLGDVFPSPALHRLRQRRAELGLPAGDADPLVIDPVTGAAPADLPLHLRKARVTRVGIDANTSICTGMLRHRYPSQSLEEDQ
jgi:metal-sulfur cluster biosynthetic enzyme